MWQQPNAAPGKMKAVAHQVRHLPSAEKKRRHESGGGHHFCELTGEKHQKFTAGILHVIASHQLRFSLWQIERDALGFRYCRSEKKQETERLKKHAPGGNPTYDRLQKTEPCGEQLAD